MNRVVHFEIHASDSERANQFYQSVFGWKIQKWEGPMEYWMVFTGDKDTPGIDGGLVKRRGEIVGEAVIAYVCTMEVESIDTMISEVESHGGHVVVPKSAIPGMGWLVYCKDTEGNIFGMMENDPNAK